MLNKNKKSIYLNIGTIKFPITAIASILHRISGVFLFIMMGPILWLLKSSLSSEEEFENLSNFLLKNNFIFKFFIWAVTTILMYHIAFGLRQILMDCGFLQQTLSIGKLSANIVFLLVICIFIYSGIFIWVTLK